METYQAPTKEQVRQYLQRRFGSNGPVPSISEIRSELGWVKLPSAAGTSQLQDDVQMECEKGAG